MSLGYPCVYHENGKCKKFSDDEAISFCVFGPCKYETPSNADRIRAMSDEELAVKISHQSISSLCDIVCGRDCKAFPTLNKTSQQRCVEIVLDWLKQPSEGKQENEHAVLEV